MSIRTYYQFCPVAMGAEIFAERWTPLVLRELMMGSEHFGELHRGLPRMSRALLAKRLRELEDAGLVNCQRDPNSRGTSYHLTDSGRELCHVVEALGRWAYRWLQTELGNEHLDSTLLMWDIQRNLHRDRLPTGRVVVNFYFPGTSRGYKRFWLVLDNGQVDLCYRNPGHEVDLWVETDVRTMTRIWLGDVTFQRAARDGRVRIEGSRRLAADFGSWLALSNFAGEKRIKPVRDMAAG